MIAERALINHSTRSALPSLGASQVVSGKLSRSHHPQHDSIKFNYKAVKTLLSVLALCGFNEAENFFNATEREARAVTRSKNISMFINKDEGEIPMERTFLLSALNYHKEARSIFRCVASFICLLSFSSLRAANNNDIVDDDDNYDNGEKSDTNKTFVNGMNLIKIYVTHCAQTEILKHRSFVLVPLPYGMICRTNVKWISGRARLTSYIPPTCAHRALLHSFNLSPRYRHYKIIFIHISDSFTLSEMLMSSLSNVIAVTRMLNACRHNSIPSSRVISNRVHIMTAIARQIAENSQINDRG